MVGLNKEHRSLEDRLPQTCVLVHCWVGSGKCLGHREHQGRAESMEKYQVSSEDRLEELRQEAGKRREERRGRRV